MIASVFSMQGIGAATAAIVGMVLLRISTKLDLVWRLCLGLGAIPGILTMYFR
jgi:PHS family inorganic phosphate transporter-like MFS transporter